MIWVAVFAGDITPGQVLGWIVAGIGVVGFLAATAQFLRGSADRGTIISLKSSVEALEIENDLKEKKIDDLLALVERQTSELEVWRNAVTAKQELQDLHKAILEHHLESVRLVHHLEQNQQQILVNQESLRTYINESETKIVAAATEVKKLVARMHGELAEVRMAVKP